MEVTLRSPNQPKTAHRVVLIAGDARSLPGDVGRFDKFAVPYDVYSIGRSVKLFPVIDHWGNVDAAESIWWAENLPDKWRNGKQIHTLGQMRGFNFWWEIPQCEYAMEDIMWHGSTALFAVQTCLAMGYERIVLAGCPLDSNGHWYFGEEVKGPRWTGECFMAWLDFKVEPESEKVRSLSGYTKTILGDVDEAWLSSRPK